MTSRSVVPWKDLIILLRGKSNIASTCDAIVDLLRDDLTSLPDLVHEVVFSLLVANASHTRRNGALLLEKVASAFSELFGKLVETSASDGVLFHLHDLNVSQIISNEGAFLMCKGASENDHVSNHSVYTKAWLKEQRDELRARIGLESGTTSTAIAATYDDSMDACIVESDIQQTQQHHKPQNHNAEVLPVTLHVTHSVPTQETWLARILRCLVVGLLDPKWEVRHGYSLGLVRIMNGLSMRADSSRVDGKHIVASVLPGFICDDIMCCGVAVLLLDRLLDFGGGAESDASVASGCLSPVKEAAGELLVIALRSHSSPAQRLTLWRLIQDMVSLPSVHWTAVLGGYIVLRHYLLLYLDKFLESDEAYNALVALLAAGVRTGTAEEVLIATCACIDALSSAYVEPEGRATKVVLQGSQVLATAVLGVCTEGLRDASPSVVTSMFRTAESLQRLVAAAFNEGARADGATAHIAVEMMIVLIDAHCALLGVVPLYDEDVQQRCLQSLASSLGSTHVLLGHLSNFTAPSPSSTTSRLAERLFRLLGGLVAACCFASSHPVRELQLEEAATGAGRKSAAKQRGLSQSKAALYAVLEPGAESETVAQEAGEALDCIGVATHYSSVRELWTLLWYQWCSCMEVVVAQLAVEFGSVLRALLTLGRGHSDLAVASSSEGARCFCEAFHTARRAFLEHEKLSVSNAFHLWEHCGESQRGVVSLLVSALVARITLSDELLGKSTDVLALLQEQVLAAHRAIRAHADIQKGALLKKDPPAEGAKRKFRFVIVPDKPSVATTPAADLSSVRVGADGSAGEIESVDRWLVGLSLVALEMRALYDVVGSLKSIIADLHAAILDVQSLRGAGSAGGSLLPLLACELSGQGDILHQDWDLRTSGAVLAQMAHCVACRTADQLRRSSNSAGCTALPKLCLDNLSRSSAGADMLLFFLAKILQLDTFSLVPELCGSAEGGTREPHRHLQSLHATVSALSAPAKEHLLTEGALLTSILRSLQSLPQGSSSQRAVETAAACIRELLQVSDTVRTAAMRQLAGLIHDAIAPTGEVTRFNSSTAGDKAAQNVAAVAQVLLELTRGQMDYILADFGVWFSSALSGIGHCDADVRVPCVLAFKQLVPVASLAQATHSRAAKPEPCADELTRDTSELLEHIFSKKAPLRLQHSTKARDLDIVRQLSLSTNLVGGRDGRESIPGLSLARLREYQWDGVSWLTQLRRFGLNGILADEMGLGKSLQALTALAVLRIEKQLVNRPFLVVCPASVVLHWGDEVARYFPAHLLCAVKFAAGQGSFEPKDASGATVVVVSYETLRRDVSRGAKSVLRGCMWEAVVLDEAHLIKNPAAGTTKAVCSLQSLHRIALSGTPVQNQVEELWSLMNFLLPDYLGDHDYFSRTVVRPIQRSFTARRELLATQAEMTQAVETTAEAQRQAGTAASLAKFHNAIELSATGLHLLRNLHKQVLPFILRRTKDVVAQDLPSKTVVDILCPLSSEQERMYREYQQRLRTSDEQLEGELKVIGDLDDVLPAVAAEIAEPESVAVDGDDLPALGGWATLGGSAGLAQSALLPAWGQEARQEEVKAKPVSRTHALESLNYLKQLCVHPALVVDAQHARYRNRLLQSADSSGKLRKLAALLLESGVITKEECANQPQLTQLLVAAEPDTEKGVQRVEEEDSDASTDDDKGDKDEIEDEDEEQDASHKPGPAGKKRKANGKATVSAESLRKRRAAGSASKTAQVAESAAELVQHDLSLELARPKHRCLVFAQHKATLDLVEELVLRRYFPEIGYRRLDGDVEPGKRAAVAREFNDQAAAQREAGTGNRCTSDEPVEAQVERMRRALPACATTRPDGSDAGTESAAPAPDIRLLLMTTRSCGLGLNLTAADTVIFVEHDWNPFADLQAMDRVHRLGQTQPVTVYRLLAEATIEARIMKLQSLKQTVASHIINEENSGSSAEGNQHGARFGDALLGSLLLRADV